MNSLEILIIYSGLLERKVVMEAVKKTGIGLVANKAPNVDIASDWLLQRSYDVILVDLYINDINSFDYIRMLKKTYPDIEFIVTCDFSKGQKGFQAKALECGALDYIEIQDELTENQCIEELSNTLHKIFTEIKLKRNRAKKHLIDTNMMHEKQVGKSSQPFDEVKYQASNELSSTFEAKDLKKLVQSTRFNSVDIILIASSTGGPIALEEVIGKLPANIDCPILVVQHMPPEYTRVMAEALNKKSKITVVEGTEGDEVIKGKIFIAPGGFHMKVSQKGSRTKVISLENTPMVNGVRPAADVLFKSVAEIYSGKNVLAVILTGMGSDGLDGIVELKRLCNCYCITQSENTCVVYGMPRCVYEAGMSDEVVDLELIADRVSQINSGRI